MRANGDTRATLCGLAAILLWSTSAGLIRGVTEDLGALGGSAMIYTVGTLLLLLCLGRPRLRTFPRAYLLVGSLLFAAYEICLSLALGYATDRAQAIELGIVNYLWPCLTVLLAIAMNGQRARWPILPGTALALFGILWVVSGEGLSLPGLLGNVAANPLSYGLAFSGAILWALYCNLTRRFAQGKNGVTLFFALTAVALWVQYGVSQEPAIPFSASGILELAATGTAMAAGYALWNLGILRGNMTLLATASYFTPVLSSAFAALWLHTALTLQFWQGALLVTLGSLLCWLATRTPGA
ncbi:aromatic amino acid DMT transporter YddG [Pseudomonas sp. RIT-PI-AD]|uniref:aromatic amino acid DMT transporter YddG n=1 Tax=Pseudomonas sp. RIT-PI-AD TaxID=3035294 RepID=UPI0021DB00C8|nr:aromatic amino acid DMT transporter YddG [Pseudomonas sp. RIT-PI-AD]